MRFKRPRDYPDWSDGWVICIASGPSLTPAQIEIVRLLHGRGAARVIAINDNWTIAPFADVLYAADHDWWSLNLLTIRARKFGGQLWSCSRMAHKQFGLNHIHATEKPGLSIWPGVISEGQNSGYQAIGLAFQFGARRIALLGYDMQRTHGRAHWFGDHPKPLRNAPGLEKWAPHFRQLADDLRTEKVNVINCSADTALTCFPRRPIGDLLKVDDENNAVDAAGDGADHAGAGQAASAGHA